MMTDQGNSVDRKKQLQLVLLVIIFLLGASLRIAKADVLPLDQIEATLAIKANTLQEANVSVTQPFYTVTTSFLFWMLDNTNFFARSVPIIAGCMLILLPWLAGDLFSDRMKLFLSFGLALDPALLAASKTAGSHMIAVTGLWLTILFFIKKKPIATGLSLAVFFMTGADFILGGLILGFTLLWILLLDPEAESVKGLLREFQWRRMFIAFTTTYVVVSSAFFTNPSGIGASFQDLTSVFQPTMIQPITIGMASLIIALFVYELLPLVLTVLHLFGNRSESVLWQRIIMWMSLFAFLVTLLNPNRTALNLIWLSVPLWIMAAGQLEKIFKGLKEFHPISLGVGLFFLLLIGFLLFTYVGAVNIEYDQQQLLIRSALIGGSFLLIIISYILTIYTWNVDVAKNALLIGLGFHLLVFGFLSQSWHSAYLGVSPQSELWRQSSYLIDADRLLETVNDISEMNHGQRQNQPLVLLGIQSPATEWLLRDHDLTVTNALTSGEAPEVVITDLVEPQLWGADYTGQDFRMSSTPNWSWLNIREWLHWAIFHEVEITTDEMAILWVRTDLFPGQTTVD